MAFLLIGLAIVIGVHLFTGLARSRREMIIKRIGEGPYKGLFSLISIAAFVLIVRGWKTMGPGEPFYIAPDWMVHIVYLLVLVGFILVAAAYSPAGKIAAATKHPMLAGFKLWAFAHLLVNGDLRSLVLFGGILAWSVVERIIAKKRGDNGRPAGPVRNDVIAIAIGTVLYAVVFVYLHPIIAGVALY